MTLVIQHKKKIRIIFRLFTQHTIWAVQNLSPKWAEISISSHTARKCTFGILFTQCLILSNVTNIQMGSRALYCFDFVCILNIYCPCCFINDFHYQKKGRFSCSGYNGSLIDQCHYPTEQFNTFSEQCITSSPRKRAIPALWALCSRRCLLVY